MYGLLASSWKREKGEFTLDVTVPANTTATVWVPGKPAGEVKGAKFLRSENGAGVYEVSSGAYTFKSAL
jgi:alpha-L-rhamnosidase